MSAAFADEMSGAGRPTLLESARCKKAAAEGQKVISPETSNRLKSTKFIDEQVVQPDVELSALVDGWMVCPALLEFGERLLEQLKKGPKMPEELANEAGITEDSLSLALHVCANLGYVSVDPATGLCSLVAGHELSDLDHALQAFPSHIAHLRALYTSAAPPFALSSHEARQCLGAWEEHRVERTKVQSRKLLQALDGAVLAPLLASLAFFSRWDEHGVELPAGVQASALALPEGELTPALGGLLEDVLRVGTLDGASGRFEASPQGRRLLEELRARLPEVSASAPVLQHLADASRSAAISMLTASAKDAKSAAHDSLKAVGQLLKEQDRLADLTSILKAVLDGGDVEAQPRHVVVELPAKGGLLKDLHRFVEEHTFRGQLLEKRPLTFIGVVASQESGASVQAALSGSSVPHLLVACDPRDPAQLGSELRRRGVELASALHVRSCLGGLVQRRAPFASGLQERSAARVFAEAQMAGLVILDEQWKCIGPLDVLASLVGYFERWGAALHETQGLCFIERVPLEASDDFGLEAASAHRRAAQFLSGEHLVPALLTSLAAAMAGLLPVSIQGTESRQDPAAHCTLLGKHLVRRDFRIRLAEPSDVPRLLELEEASWAPEHRGSREVLLRRLETSPTTNLVCTKGGKVVAVLYMQRIDDKAAVDRQTIFEVSDGHVPKGRYLQLIAIAADRSNGGIGSELRAFALHLARLDPTIESVVAVTLARSFKRFDGSMQQYVDAHVNGALFDPIIGFHTSFGARVQRLVHGYRPKDVENQGIGVLIEYDIASMQGIGATAKATGAGSRIDKDGQEQVQVMAEPKSRAAEQHLPANACADAGRVPMNKLIADEIRQFDYVVDESELSRGFLDLGLDSVELGALKAGLGRKLGLSLPKTLLFDFPCIEELGKELDRLVAGDVAAQARPQACKLSMTELIVSTVRGLGYEVDEENLWQGFMDHGLDSVEVGALRASLSTKLGLHLSPTLMFDFPSVEALSKELRRLVGEESAAEERATSKPMNQDGLRAGIMENLDFDLAAGNLSDMSFLEELGTELEGLLKAKQGRAAREAPATAKDLFWNELTCGELESVQRALIDHFRQPKVRLMLAQKRQACNQDRLKYLYCIDGIIDDGHAEVFRRMGLLGEAESLKEVQEKFQRALMQFWREGQVRALSQELRVAKGEAPPRQVDVVPEQQHKQLMLSARRGWGAAAAMRGGRRGPSALARLR